MPIHLRILSLILLIVVILCLVISFSKNQSYVPKVDNIKPAPLVQLLPSQICNDPNGCKG